MAKDDLTQIPGIGPATVKKLAGEGVTSFAQMAEWDEDEMDRLDVKLGLKGKIRSDDWRGQAKDKLAQASSTDDDGADTDTDTDTDEDDELARFEAELAREEEEQAKQDKAAQKAAAAAEPKQKGKQRRRLDRRKKVSEVYGAHRGASYMQVINGKDVYFTAGEVEMFDGEDAVDAIGSSEAPHEAKTPDDVNFLNYLDKKQEVPFALLKQAIQQRYGRPVKTVREAKEFLHESLRTNY